MSTDISTMTAKLPTVASVVAVIATLLMSYFSMSAKVDATTAALVSLRTEHSAAMSDLMKRMDNFDVRNREQERLILELVTTLRVKGIIR